MTLTPGHLDRIAFALQWCNHRHDNGEDAEKDLAELEAAVRREIPPRRDDHLPQDPLPLDGLQHTDMEGTPR